MKFGKLFVLFGILVLIVVIAFCFSMYKMELFNIGTRVRSPCDNNLIANERGVLLLQQNRGSKQHKIGGNFIERCGGCTFNNSLSNPSKITMSCFCKNSEGVCGSKLSSIDLNIGDIDVSPDGNMIYPSSAISTSTPAPIPTPTLTLTPTPTTPPTTPPTPTQQSLPKTTQASV